MKKRGDGIVKRRSVVGGVPQRYDASHCGQKGEQGQAEKSDPERDVEITSLEGKKGQQCAERKRRMLRPRGEKYP